MGAAEKFCLRWNDFESNISGAFRELRDDKDFFDVTLACDDDQVQAHKVILSACSPFFRTILRRNRHEHPLLYLKGVKYVDLVSVLNFMYHGEVNVAQEELNSFLAVAEDLKIKGLTQNNSDSKPRNIRTDLPKPHVKDPPVQAVLPKRPRPLPQVPRAPASSTNSYQQEDDDVQEVVPVKSEPISIPADTANNSYSAMVEKSYTSDTTQLAQEGIVADPNMEYGEEYGDYEENYVGQEGGYEGAVGTVGQDETKDFNSAISGVLSYDSINRVWQCTECGKSNTDKARVRRHAEIHFQGFVHACPHCGCQKKTSTALRYHIHAYHTKKQ